MEPGAIGESGIDDLKLQMKQAAGIPRCARSFSPSTHPAAK
jgi:hypothetical protein